VAPSSAVTITTEPRAPAARSGAFFDDGDKTDVHDAPRAPVDPRTHDIETTTQASASEIEDWFGRERDGAPASSDRKSRTAAISTEDTIKMGPELEQELERIRAELLARPPKSSSKRRRQ
jgi:hypothetical protein